MYQPLFQQQSLQFSQRIPLLNPRLGKVTRLACPILDNREILGNLWLFRPKGKVFNELEIQLVQQVANQCAIAIRQARLYEVAQGQITELAQLDRLKTEFLKTLSHELRTPVTNVSLAIQTLETVLEQGRHWIRISTGTQIGKTIGSINRSEGRCEPNYIYSEISSQDDCKRKSLFHKA